MHACARSLVDRCPVLQHADIDVRKHIHACMHTCMHTYIEAYNDLMHCTTLNSTPRMVDRAVDTAAGHGARMKLAGQGPTSSDWVGRADGGVQGFGFGHSGSGRLGV